MNHLLVQPARKALRLLDMERPAGRDGIAGLARRRAMQILMRNGQALAVGMTKAWTLAPAEAPQIETC
jgi:hypothetical protein